MVTLKSPIFVLSAPFSGELLLADSLSRAGGVWHWSSASTFLDDLAPDDDRLGAEAAATRADSARGSLAASIVDREGSAPEDADRPVRALAAGPRLALRAGFLARAFPDAKFVASYRDPADACAEMLAAWRSGRYVSRPDLPDWEGAPWSLPLIPAWRELRGRPLEEIVVAQWSAISELLLDDLGGLAPGRWAVTSLAELLAQPRAELQRLCGFLEVPYDQALLTPVEAAARALASSSEPPHALAAALELTGAAQERWTEILAKPPTVSSRARPQPFASVSTATFAQILRNRRGSVLISTYQSGRLICARNRDGVLNTHFRQFDKPMGIAVAPGRFALATRTEVWDYRDVPAVAPKLEPPGHDACYIPRNRHLTGDTLMHELAFAGGELWMCATGFSCLATIDGDHSFIPRWKPPFISELSSDDRCHLNGLAVRDDAPAFVTALGQSDEPGGWRRNKATGGCVIDVASGETVVGGLSMPHSPRWHGGRLWVLESGRGTLAAVDLQRGTAETVIELPGFTRGLALTGDLAFVGLSQIRESSTFGDLPLTARLKERVSGVWVISLEHATIAAFLRFEDLVQEIFDVALLRGVRFPEIAEPGSTAASTTFVFP